MKKMLTVMAGVVAAGSLMSSIARADVILGENKSTWSPYPVEVTAKDNVKLGGDESSKSANSVEGEKVGLPNPWSDVKDLKEAEKKTGIKLTAPKKIKGFDEISYQVLLKKDKIVQIDYRKDDNNSVAIRKGISKKDISGDYNEYKNTKKVTVKGNKIKLQGNGKTYSLATWTKGKYSFSVGIYNDGKGMSLKEIKNIIGQVK